MDWPDDLTGALPPRGDEPAQLRNDIVDELSDHLISAVARERRGTADDATARRAALARFGNPAAVARRLWFDNMKGYVMTQRIMLALVSVMAVALLGAMALAWNAFQENRAVNEAMLARLESLADRPRAEPLSEYCKLTVRVTKGSENGEPAVGYGVNLEGKAINPIEKVTLWEGTDEDGAVSFSPILPGQYSVTTSTPWGDRNQQSVTLLPGSERTINVVTRDGPFQEVDVSFRVDWPEDLQNEQVLLDCHYSSPESQYEVSGSQWYHSLNPVITVDPSGQVVVAVSVRLFLSGSHVLLVDREVPSRATVKRRVGTYVFGSIDLYVRDTPRDRGTRFGYRMIGMYPIAGQPLFEAVAGKSNQWTIELPDKLIETLRKRRLPVPAETAAEQ